MTASTSQPEPCPMAPYAPQQTVAAAQESAGCTCPSGDGSLRWPCPQHPPTVVHVHHHDIEAHAASWNEGYAEAMRQSVGGAERRDWVIQRVGELLSLPADEITPDMIADEVLTEVDLTPPADAPEQQDDDLPAFADSQEQCDIAEVLHADGTLVWGVALVKAQQIVDLIAARRPAEADQ